MAVIKVSDVRKMLERGEDTLTGPYLVYVTNFHSQYPWPRTHTYRGCCICSTSIEGGWSCGHSLVPNAGHNRLFRFDIIFVDAYHGGQPMRGCIFDGARKLLGIGPDEFQQLSDDCQKARLHSMTVSCPLVNVWIRTHPEKGCIINKLELVPIDLDTPPSSPPRHYFSPASKFGPGTPYDSTPRGTGSSSTSLSRSRGKAMLDDGDHDEIKRSLEQALELLALSKSSEKREKK